MFEWFQRRNPAVITVYAEYVSDDVAEWVMQCGGRVRGKRLTLPRSGVGFGIHDNGYSLHYTDHPLILYVPHANCIPLVLKPVQLLSLEHVA